MTNRYAFGLRFLCKLQFNFRGNMTERQTFYGVDPNARQCHSNAATIPSHINVAANKSIVVSIDAVNTSPEQAIKKFGQRDVVWKSLLRKFRRFLKYQIFGWKSGKRELERANELANSCFRSITAWMEDNKHTNLGNFVATAAKNKIKAFALRIIFTRRALSLLLSKRLLPLNIEKLIRDSNLKVISTTVMSHPSR